MRWNLSKIVQTHTDAATTAAIYNVPSKWKQLEILNAWKNLQWERKKLTEWWLLNAANAKRGDDDINAERRCEGKREFIKEFSFTAQTRKRTNKEKNTHTHHTSTDFEWNFKSAHSTPDWHTENKRTIKQMLIMVQKFNGIKLRWLCAVWVCALWKFVIRFRTNEHNYNRKLVNTWTFVLDQMGQETEAPRERERLKQLVQ